MIRPSIPSRSGRKDGQSLYFTSDRAGGPQIYKVGLQPGDRPRRLTFQGNYNARPRVSPDESQLAFVTQEEGAYRIAVMDLKGRGDVQVLTKGQFDVSPSYAPNGAMIIYASRDRGRGVLALVTPDWPRAGAAGLERGRGARTRLVAVLRSMYRPTTVHNARGFALGYQPALGWEFNEKNRIDRLFVRGRSAARRLPEEGHDRRTTDRGQPGAGCRRCTSGAEGASTSTSPLGGDAGAHGGAQGARARTHRSVGSSISTSTNPTSSRSLPPSSRANAQFLAAHPTAKLKLEGNTDERGTREYNIGLGERRAQAVRRALMLQGASGESAHHGELRGGAPGGGGRR